MPDPLDTYRAKRHFARTAEPSGETTEGDAAAGEGQEGGAGPARFVVQKHAARRLHYDFRLEADGVLVSWAVPKGPSYDPKAKRLAVPVEDHPLDYRDFAGTIPSGEYGGGAVIVWDEGTYRHLADDKRRSTEVVDAVRAGHLSVWLEGAKLRGGWSLTRTGEGTGGKESWIMVKRRDETADPERDVETAAPDSVKTGRSVEQVAANRESSDEWTPGQATWRPPMRAEPTTPAAHGQVAGQDPWVYEPRLEGVRAVGVRNRDQVELWSETHERLTAHFPDVVAALASVPADTFAVDGMIVQPGVYRVFDLLQLLGRDTTGLPLTDRKRLAAQLLAGARDVVGSVEEVGGPARPGLVAKRAGSPYRSGPAGDDWQELAPG
ncbi:MAG: DNA polymerase ligase N-terminal domain-containing protein [Acidimicrobiales bacterium]